jgi:hypothetical protein
MKCSETEPSQVTGSGGCVGGANLNQRFRLAPPSSLADGAFSIAVMHLTKSAQSGLKIPQPDGVPSMCSAYLARDWRALQ